MDIVKIIQSINGNIYTVYTDWIKMCAISISNSVKYSEKMELEYKSIISKYSNEELDRMIQAFGILQMLAEEKYDDYLGSMYMMLETGSKRTGQFFTPYHLSKLMAEFPQTEPKKEHRIVINEPSCGGGANIIAYIERLKREGINYQTDYEIIAQDLDWNCVYMCYVQLSLFGVYGKVIHGDTLKMDNPEKGHVLYTPMYMLQRGGA